MSDSFAPETLLAALDRPAVPRAAFADALLDRLVVELNGPARRRRRGRRLMLALAAAVVVVAVATAVAAALGHDVFGSWLRGSPGRPASPEQAAGFVQRNGASYAAFPSHTRLRLLQTGSHHHRSFSLLGFRNGPAFCLRLVPTRAPAALGVNQCLSLRELQSARAPALAASTAHFRAVDAVFGFADDSVRRLEVRHVRGDVQLVRVVNDSFVELHGSADPIVSIAAHTRDGRTFAVPFAPALGVQAPNGIPSYVGMERARLAGPTHAVRLHGRSRIAWLANEEQRGEPFQVDPRFPQFLRGSIVFSRAVQPDPSDPYKLGVALIKSGRHAPRAIVSFSGHSVQRVRPGQMLLCLFELFPLRARPLGGLCGSASLRDAVITRVLFRELFTRVSGLAADSVRTMQLILSGGRVVPVALRDNVYTVEAPSDEFPAKLVAYDGAHRPVAVNVVPSDERAVVRPCPAPTAVRAAGSVPPYDRVDLATGRVDGHVVLGRPLAEIEAAFGRPASTSPHRVTPAMTAVEISYGSGLTITFHRTGRIFRAVSLQYRDPRLIMAGVGHALQVPPTELQRRIASAVGSRYRLVASYGSQPSRLGCSGVFLTRVGGGRLLFGLDPVSREPSLFISR